MRGFTFLPRRVPMNAPDNELEDSKERDHRLETWGARAVIFGIGVEFVLAVIFREHKSLLENWGPVTADALVGLGIVAEVHFAARAGEKSEELRRRSSERLSEAILKASHANERAAKAERDAAEARERTATIERFIAKRTIEPELRSVLISTLTDLLAFKVACVEYEVGDTEAWQFASEIAEVFRRSKCIDVHGRSNRFLTVPLFGVFIASAADVPITPILTAFTEAGMSVFRTDIPASALVDRLDISVYVFVALKPPAELERHFFALSSAHVQFAENAE